MQIKLNLSSKVPSLIIEIFTVFTNLFFGSELCLGKNIVNYFCKYVLGQYSHSVLSNICIHNFKALFLSITYCLMLFSEERKINQKQKVFQAKKEVSPKGIIHIY